tara:strand:+ start:2329 stop:4614 length:2286 start_codon:yes stop_codon:yes gene_type:complete
MGGVAGHLAHLYDNRDLTYTEMAEILTAASQGELIGTEKTDGYNIYLGYVDGQVRAARNKGDMSRGGMTLEDLINRTFKGGEKTKKTYVTAFKAYKQAVDSLSEEERNSIFGLEGDIFYNTEIQGPIAPNVVNYDENIIAIHHMGHKRYNKETNDLEVVEAVQESQALDQVIDRFEEMKTEESFSVKRTAFLKLNQLDDDVHLKTALSKIRNTGYQGDMTIGDYLYTNLMRQIRQQSNLPPSIIKLVANRILKNPGYLSLTKLKKILKERGTEESYSAVKDIVDNSNTEIKKLIWPIELAIHDFAVEMLRSLRSAYILDGPAEVDRIKKDVEQAINSIHKYDGPHKDEAHEILAKQLGKLKTHDNIDTVVEGFVFQWKGQMYKFTGNFAPINQLLGLFRYGRGHMPPMSLNALKESFTGVPEGTINRVIAIYPGRFQPMGAHHAEVFKMIQENFGEENTFISTTGVTELSDKGGVPKSPFNFEEKKAIMVRYEIPENNIVMTGNPYTAKEILEDFDPETTSVVFFVGKKDMQTESPRFNVGTTKKGKPTYFQHYEENLDDLKTYSENGYLAIAPHVSINIPDIGEMSGTNIRLALKGTEGNPKGFKDIMGWYDETLHNMIVNKLKNVELKEDSRFHVGIFLRLIEEEIDRTLSEGLDFEKMSTQDKAIYFLQQAGDETKGIAAMETETASTVAEKDAALEEMSSGAGGAAGGFSVGLGAIETKPVRRKIKRKKKKKKKTKLEEQFIDEVYNYLIKTMGRTT